jgi:hypothetical protein
VQNKHKLPTYHIMCAHCGTDDEYKGFVVERDFGRDGRKQAQSAAISAEPESLGMMANNYSVFPPAPINVEQPCPLRS